LFKVSDLFTSAALTLNDWLAAVRENKMSVMFQPASRLLPRLSGVAGRRNFFIYSPNALTPQVDREPEWKKAEEAVTAIQSGNSLLFTFLIYTLLIGLTYTHTSFIVAKPFILRCLNIKMGL